MKRFSGSSGIDKQGLLRKVGWVSVIMFTASASQMLANLILGRTLSSEDYGMFSFIRKLIMFASFFVLLSMDAGLIRMVSPGVLAVSHWRQYLIRALGVVLLLTSLPVALAWTLYELPVAYLLIVYLIVCISGFMLLSNAILRINEKFMQAQLLVSGFRLVFLFILLIIWIVGTVTLDSSLGWLLFAYATVILIALAFLKKLPGGNAPIPFRSTLKNSSEYYLLTLATIVFVVIDTFFVAKMMGFERAGIYSAVSLLPVTVFNISGSSIGQVLMPLLAAGKKIAWRKIALLWLGMSLPLSLFFVIFTDRLNHFFFAGRYDGYPILIYLFVLVGLFQLTGIFLYSILGGMGTRRYLRLYLAGSLIVQLVHVMAMMGVTRSGYGIHGIAAVTAFFWMVRDLTGVSLIVLQVLRQRKTLGNPSQTGATS